MHHYIQRQKIELTLSERKEAFRLQQLVSDHYRKEIVAILEKAFDEVSLSEEILQIDTLEIDLGRIREKDIVKGNWAEIIYKKVTEKLNLLVRAPLPGIHTVKESQLIHAAEQWLYYMENGHLPWSINKPGNDWYMRVLQAFASDTRSIERLRAFIQGSGRGTTRIVLQHPVEFLVSLAEALTACNQKELPVMLHELAEIMAFLGRWSKKELSQKRMLFSHRAWQSVLVYAAKQYQDASAVRIIQSILRSEPLADDWAISLPHRFFATSRHTAGIIRVIRSLQLKKREKTAKDGTKPVGQDDTGELAVINKQGANFDIPLEETVLQDKNVLPLQPQDRKHVSKTSPPDESVYVLNAGLILVHPFLPPFFRNLGLLDKHAFKDITRQQKALFLLHFLGTGKTTAEEHELVMEKLLCGYPLQMPVPIQVELSREELSEGAELLGNMISHWKILKNTSAEGLRESFLQRKGKLGKGKEGPLVQVERASIDVLLDDLPWNYSMIQLPWRKDLIRVEW